MSERNLPTQIFPEPLIQEIIDTIFVEEAPHRPDLMYLEYEEIEAIVRLTILQLEKWALFDEEKLENLDILDEIIEEIEKIKDGEDEYGGGIII